MVTIPANVKALFNDKEACKVIATACVNGKPHVVPAGTIGVADDTTMMVCQIFMDVTAKNLEKNPKASFGVIKGMESYTVNTELKAKVTEGPLFDQMSKAIMDALHLPVKSVLLFDVKSVYNQSASMEAGKKMA
ncbi:MAG: pyridoxamine 5'-phosphate oxidase family protein [Candidatus Methanomethylophilaceae archaeon]|nr:pyridoxamine 5'-phosphate oxidase family protein [Candidatus Methanomethylophilaceae archaeon]